MYFVFFSRTMDTSQRILKTLAKLSLAALGILFILGIIFYKERVLLMDASYYLFTIINEGKLFPEGGRYGSLITQVLPYLGQKMHLPLKTLMLLYGMSFYLFYFTVAILLVYSFKQYRLAILMALFYLSFVSQSFIWINEIYAGVAWMFLFFGVTLHLGSKQVRIFLFLPPFILFAFLALYSHVTIMIPTIFLWVYLIIEKKNWPFTGKITVLLSFLLFAIISLKFIMALNNPHWSYDADRLHGVTHFSLQDIIDSFNTPIIKMFLRRCLVNYWLGAMLFIIGIINLVKNGQIALTTWVLLTGLGYFIVMGLTYGKTDENFDLIHVESEWVCFGIIAATAWVFSFLPGRKSALISCLLTGIFVVRLVYIGITIPMFSARNEVKDHILGANEKERDHQISIV